MWRSRLLATIMLVMGLAVVVALLVVASTKRASADDQPVFTPATLISKTCNLPGEWQVRIQNQPQRVLVTENTQFLPTGQQCENFVDTERITIGLIVRPPATLEAASIERVPPTSVSTDITFRGTLTTNPSLTYPQNWVFETGSGRQAIYVSHESIVTPPAQGVPIRAGLKADVIASRQGNQLSAKSIVFVPINPEVTFSGPIQSYPTSNPRYIGMWVVGGRNVQVDSGTTVNGTPALYRQATVKARIVGFLLQALEITINDRDTKYTEFELKGVLTDVPGVGQTPGKVGGCIAVFVIPPLTIDASWRNKSIHLIGPRNARRLEAQEKKDGPSGVANNWFSLQGVVENRVQVGDNTTLIIGGVEFSVSNDTPNLSNAVRGSAVLLTGTCEQTGPFMREPVVSSLEVVAKGLVSFTGPIRSVEPNPTGIRARFTITNLLSNETQVVFLRENRLGPTGYPAVPGATITGEGYLQDDGSIDATTINVVIPAMTPTPTPTLTGFRSIGPGPGEGTKWPEAAFTPTPPSTR